MSPRLLCMILLKGFLKCLKKALMEVKEGDVVKEVDEPSYIDPQVRLF